MTDVGGARVEVTGDVRNFARQTEQDLDAALSKINVDPITVPVDTEGIRQSAEQAGVALGDGVTRGADGRLRDARGQFVKMGEEAGAVLGDGITRGADGRLRNARGQFVSGGSSIGEALASSASSVFSSVFGKGLSSIVGALGSNPYVAAAGIALGGGIAAAALPAIGAALSGAILGGAGLGVIGLGAFLLREDPAIRNAAKSLGDSVKETFTQAARPMIQPLLIALGTFQNLIKEIGPEVGQIFQTLADSGAIEALATGLAGLVENALPGFVKLMEQAGPFLVAFGESLPEIGTGLSQMFTAIAAGAPGAIAFFTDFISFTAGALAGFGAFIGWLSSAYPVVVQFFNDAQALAVATWQRMVEFGAQVIAAVQPLVPIFQGIWTVISSLVITAWNLIKNAVTTGINVVKAVIATVSAAIRGDWQGTWNGMKAFVTAIWNGIKGVVSSLINGLAGVISGTLQGIRSAWSVAWNGMTTIVRNAGNAIKSASTGLINTIKGAFASAGSWLRSAGSNIIDGLINGIRAGFDRVRNTLSSLTALLPDWKGPAEVDRKILEPSGDMIMEGFERGLENRFDSVRRKLAGLTADLPDFAGTVRGGDGASAAAPAGMNVTIMPGAVVIHGGGRAAGQEAADALLDRLGQAVLAR